MRTVHKHMQTFLFLLFPHREINYLYPLCACGCVSFCPFLCFWDSDSVFHLRPPCSHRRVSASAQCCWGLLGVCVCVCSKAHIFELVGCPWVIYVYECVCTSWLLFCGLLGCWIWALGLHRVLSTTKCVSVCVCVYLICIGVKRINMVLCCGLKWI